MQHLYMVSTMTECPLTVVEVSTCGSLKNVNLCLYRWDLKVLSVCLGEVSLMRG